jgi:integrase-like protein
VIVDGEVDVLPAGVWTSSQAVAEDPLARRVKLVKTLLREWAFRFAYPTSTHRARPLPGYLRWYNTHRPHGSLGGKPPLNRVSQVRGRHN